MIKLNPLIRILALATLIALPTVGCKKNPTGVTKLPPAPPTGQPNDPGVGNALGGDKPPTVDTTSGTPLGARGSHDGWTENASMFSADTVHFDYDSSAVKSSEKSKVKAVADYLKGSSADAVKIQGHCDERGTAEYNRALGERRALALREELVRDGIDGTRVDTISFGADQPVDNGHSESAWKQNRRGVFILLTPPK
jgi:peptidoglycan-associated lipoprotein